MSRYQGRCREHPKNAGYFVTTLYVTPVGAAGNPFLPCRFLTQVNKKINYI